MMPAETAHHVTLGMLKFAFSIPVLNRMLQKLLQVKGEEKLGVTVAGIRFPNGIGLAAGFDKNAKYFKEMAALGFGFVEIGTVTPKAQDGNPKPRLFRLKKDSAIINRMGFNNDGLEPVIERLKKRPKGLVVGGNIGKNKVTDNENATEDYIACFEALYPHVDYFTLNVSSPNTPNLRALQDREPLEKLLSEIMKRRNNKEQKLPVFLKIAPDLTAEQIAEVAEIALQTEIDGVIATNTTISREGLQEKAENVAAIGAGGLSGKPLTQKSTEVVRLLHTRLQGKIPVIAVGGIHTPTDAIEKINAGAALIQLYTGFIYEGPSLIRNIKKEWLKRNSPH